MGVFSVSCASSVLMTLYVAVATFNIYRLMFPLALLDLSPYGQESYVRPLWDPATPVHLRVYLSTSQDFNVPFLEESFREDGSRRHVELLWDELVDEQSPSFSKSFLLTTSSCVGVTGCPDGSLESATRWLDETELQALERKEAGVMSVVAGAGQGIESTSVLLSFYLTAADHLRSLLGLLGLGSKEETSTKEQQSRQELLRDRATIRLPRDSLLWSALHHNATLFVHVVLLNAKTVDHWPPVDINSTKREIISASRSHNLLLGKVKMVKWDTPTHVKAPTRILYHDLLYVLRRFLFRAKDQHPPWNMKHSKPEDYAVHQQALRMKSEGVGYPYWKPMVSVKYVNDLVEYPHELAHLSGMPLVQVRPSRQHPTGVSFTPAIHVDEIGLTSEKYIAVNETVTSLPLRISFDRSDIEHAFSTASATAGGVSPARWRLLSHLSEAIESQKALGFDESDIDDVRRLIADTNVTLLAITMLASALHLLFEFLTFKNEVSFWKNNKDLTGLSVRSLFLDVMGQAVILLYLIERESSLLITVPSGIGLLIAVWKCQRASGLQIMKVSEDRKVLDSVPWWNRVPRFFGFEFRAIRLERMNKVSDGTAALSKKDELRELTLESDRLATRTLGAVLFPAVAGYAVYSFLTQEYTGWYSWLVTTASSAVYALGFVLMTPQLFLNWKLKSVAHLPWKVLGYKFVNTFIDDLFSFVIRMPTMARISCFRDDIVFFIYLYQRWLYPVDTSRPVEGVGEVVEQETSSFDSETKKRQ